jgi:diadenosine tetraphosphate (Ap4A) HIT family hydrolase
VVSTARFVAVPTLGQIFEGSLLILPKAHVETCAAVENDAHAEMLGLLDQALIRCAGFGSPIFFEHGAAAASGGGCGIHHAHLHVVPLPSKVGTDLLFPEATNFSADLAGAWAALTETDHYLLIGNSENVRFRNLEADPGRFPSQFFRRRLAEHFGLEKPWDWRSYSQIEPELLRTLAEASTNAI